MERRRVVQGAFVIAIGILSLSINGCVPGVIVEWTIATNNNGISSEHDIELLRRLLYKLGYVKEDVSSRSDLNAQFFSFSMSQRINIALLQDKNGSIHLKFVEHGEKQLSSIGRQQVTLIAEGLTREFGRNRVQVTGSPADVSRR